MQARQQEFLRTNLSRLRDTTTVDTFLLDTCYESGILSRLEWEQLKAEPVNHERSSLFYGDILPNKTPEQFEKTVEILGICEKNLPMNILNEHLLQNPINGPAMIMQIVGNHVEVWPERMEEILKKVGDKKFVIYSINGKMRGGKSLLLSCILDYRLSNFDTNWIHGFANNSQRFFKWVRGVDPKTKGIWVWPDPIIATDKNGEQIAVLLMDCQGESDNATTTQQNAHIFAMSAFLSSVLIYNIQGVVSENELQPLLLFLDVALKHFPVNSELKTFQKLVILNRDADGEFEQGYYTKDSGPGGSARNLFNHIFDPPTLAPENKRSREQILSSFEQVGAYALRHPGMDVHNGRITSNIEQKFLSGVMEFTKTLFSKDALVPKTVRGSPVTGNQFLPCFQAMASILNQNDLPAVPSFYQGVAESFQLIAKENCVRIFKESMTNLLSQNPDGLRADLFQAQVSQACQQCVQLFLDKPLLGDERLTNRHKAELEEELKGSGESFGNTNTANLEAKASRDSAAAAIVLADNRKAEAVTSAQQNRDSVAEALQVAKNKLASIHANVQGYHWSKTVQVKHRNRFMGIVVSPTYSTQTVSGFNQEHFNRDIADATAEIAAAEQRLAQAEQSLRNAQAM